MIDCLCYTLIYNIIIDSSPSLSFFILWFLRRLIIKIPPTNCRPTGTTPLHPTIPAYKEKAIPPLCTNVKGLGFLIYNIIIDIDSLCKDKFKK